jgi:hypothetical protein
MKTLILAGLVIAIIYGCTLTQAAAESSHECTLEGEARFTKSDGGTESIRGLEIFICKPEIDERIAALRMISLSKLSDPKAFPSADDTRKRNNLYGELLKQDAGSIKNIIPLYKVTSMKTGIDGRCSIAGLEPGKYSLYAFHSCDEFFGFWLLPVYLTPGCTVKAAFQKDTMRAYRLTGSHKGLHPQSPGAHKSPFPAAPGNSKAKKHKK